MEDPDIDDHKCLGALQRWWKTCGGNESQQTGINVFRDFLHFARKHFYENRTLCDIIL